MQFVHNKAKPAVTETVVVSPAQAETFDLIGLSAEQVAAIFILTGETSGNVSSVHDLFNLTKNALGLTFACLPDTAQVMQGTLIGPRLERQVVADVLAYRQPQAPL